MTYTLYFDGKAEPNPGKGSAGAVLYKDDAIICKVGKYMPNTTNNQAEYTGLIIGLQECVKRKIKEVDVFGDSNLVINQSNKVWAVKNEGLKDLNAIVMSLKKEFTNITFTHVYRDKNTVADEITNIVHAQEKDLGSVEAIVIKKFDMEKRF